MKSQKRNKFSNKTHPQWLAQHDLAGKCLSEHQYELWIISEVQRVMRIYESELFLNSQAMQAKYAKKNTRRTKTTTLFSVVEKCNTKLFW
jgi:hypothetical protein